MTLVCFSFCVFIKSKENSIYYKVTQQHENNPKEERANSEST
jgi:hypothetical protein